MVEKPQSQTGDNQNKKQEVPEAMTKQQQQVNEINTGTTVNDNGSDKGESPLERADRIIREYKAKAKENGGGGNFLDIKDGETKIVRFDLSRIKEVEREIPRQDGTKARIQRIEYDGLIDVNNPTAGEKRKDFAHKWAEMINDQLREGFRVLKITRSGSGKNDTNYKITPVNTANTASAAT
jgi:hypothetical protein